MFLYLYSGGRVYLPDAVRAVHAETVEPVGEVSFLSEDGRVVAVFRRQDVVGYGTEDLGEILSDIGGGASEHDQKEIF